MAACLRFKAALAAILLVAAASAAPAAAQGASKIVNFPAEKFNVAPGGVDMRSGRFVYSETDLSAGPLSLARTMPEKVAGHANPFGNFSHNWDIFLLETRTDLYEGNRVGLDYRMNVHHGGRSFTFESLRHSQGYSYKSDSAPASLTFTGDDKSNGGTVYTYESRGTVLTFRPIGSGDCADEYWDVGGRRRCAFVSQMIEPDGTRYTFEYASTGGGTGNLARLRQVTSSRGYALLLEGGGTRVTRACLLNLALTSVPADGLCPAGALATARYSYEPGGRLASATSPGGSTSGFTYSAQPDQAGAMGFVKPGQSAPWLTNHVVYVSDEEYARQEVVGFQAFADGQTYAYGFDRSPVTTARPEQTIAGGGYNDAEGRVTFVRYDFPLLPGSGPTTHCRRFPCSNDSPDDIFSYIYQQTPGPVEVIDPLGRRTLMDYCDPLLLGSPPPYGGCAVYPLQWSMDPEGIKTVLGYDGQRNIIKATRYPRAGAPDPDGSAPAPIVTEAGYDLVHSKLAGKPLWIRDPNGNVTRWTYAPEHGGVLTETGPAVNGVTPQKRYSYIQRYARGPDGSIFAPPAPVWLLGRLSTCRTGNPAGDGCALGPADEVVTTYDYGPDRPGTNLDLLGQAVTADGQTLRTCYAYDALGRKISETSPNGTAGLTSCPLAAPTAGLPYTTSTRYDPDGQVTGTIAPDPDGPGGNGAPAVRNTYDPAGRLVKVEQGALAAWQPHNVAPSAWTGFAVHKVVDTRFDALDRKTREAVSGGGITASVTEYSYDKRGLLLCTAVRMNPDAWAAELPDKCVPGPAHAVHGADRISRNIHDDAGQLIETWDGVGTPLQRREAAYTYDGNGQKTSLTDARGFRAEMRYDGHGRRQRWIFPSKTTPGVADQADYEQYRHDPAGNRTSLRKRDGSTLAYRYDALNRMTAKLVPERAGLTAAQTRDIYYEYDLRGLQTEARFDGPANDFVRTWYDGFGRPATILSHMSGQPRYLNHQYDRDGKREHLTFANDGARFRYFHDGLGRVTHLTDKANVASADDYVIRYFYRPEGPRYVAIRGAGAAGFTTAYHYDPVQRPAMMVNDLPGTANDMTVSLAYNPASQIRHYGRDNDSYAWRGSLPDSRAYTVNGQNQYLASGPAAFGYDPNGNLVRDTSNAYVYDVENRLVSATGDRNATLVYDPLGRLAEVSGGPAGVTRFQYDGDRLVAEYDAAGNLLKRYVHGPGTDEPVAVYEGPALGLANRRYMLPDERGSIAALVNADGTPSAINTYNEYGVPGAEPSGRFGYTGQTWIPELGLWYYKARLYSSRLGRFLQVDPIGYEDQINLYAYVGNDPINGRDPTGMCNTAASRICGESERQLKAARVEGVRKAWAAERKLVAAGGGTKAWTRAERAELLRDGKVKGYEAHHINTVKGNPIDLARNPKNILFVKPAEHVQIHRDAGGYRQPITGKPMIARSFGLFNALTMVTGALSGRIRTDNLDNFAADLFGYESVGDTIERERRFCEAAGLKYNGVPCA